MITTIVSIWPVCAVMLRLFVHSVIVRDLTDRVESVTVYDLGNGEAYSHDLTKDHNFWAEFPVINTDKFIYHSGPHNKPAEIWSVGETCVKHEGAVNTRFVEAVETHGQILTISYTTNPQSVCVRPAVGSAEWTPMITFGEGANSGANGYRPIPSLNNQLLLFAYSGYTNVKEQPIDYLNFKFVHTITAQSPMTVVDDVIYYVLDGTGKYNMWMTADHRNDGKNTELSTCVESHYDIVGMKPIDDRTFAVASVVGDPVGESKDMHFHVNYYDIRNLSMPVAEVFDLFLPDRQGKIYDVNL